jgi:hypothetical protein
LAGTAALTATSASWSFSRLMVSRIGNQGVRKGRRFQASMRILWLVLIGRREFW